MLGLGVYVKVSVLSKSRDWWFDGGDVDRPRLCCVVRGSSSRGYTRGGGLVMSWTCPECVGKNSPYSERA